MKLVLIIKNPALKARGAGYSFSAVPPFLPPFCKGGLSGYGDVPHTLIL